MNGSSQLHQTSPALGMSIQGYGHDLSSNGWTVERMVIDEATHESETGLLSPLKTLFDYWREKNWGHGYFDPVADLDIRVQCVDVGCEDPLQYQYLHHFGETFGNRTGKRMMDLPSLSQKAQRESRFRLADFISWEYAEVKKIRVPMYYRLEHEISGSLRRQYTKIILPPIRNKPFLTTRLTAPLEIHTPNTTR